MVWQLADLVNVAGENSKFVIISCLKISVGKCGCGFSGEKWVSAVPRVFVGFNVTNILAET